ncbi:MAG TPA: hypothetical protein VEU98_04435, partial [Candidatus Eremiobacteraceae bacterium]|nr:hypothetical protein [Candidatus Eremiobacteraceae bacterium]
MNRIVRIATVATSLTLPVLAMHFVSLATHAQDSSFHNAPASAKSAKNPYQGDVESGRPLY